MDAAALRAAFPVTADLAYLNAGTCGPLAAAARDATVAAIEQATAIGRMGAYYEQLRDLRERQRTAGAARLGAAPADVALTLSTSDGLARVLGGLDLRPGDEILTADDEHPGLYGSLVAARARHGVTLRAAPLADLADAVGPKTALVACSHVSWITGSLAPAELAELEIPVLLDGAQGVGAIPIDVGALGCAFYAGSGQKWLCGPVGTGLLWIDPEWSERVAPAGLGYMNLEDASAGLDAVPWTDARRHDAPSIPLESIAAAVAADETLAAFGWPAVHERAVAQAARLADLLRERGRTVAERDATTLVSWESPDPAAERDRLAAAGVVVRDLPATPYVRASVGAWNDEDDLRRLLSAL